MATFVTQHTLQHFRIGNQSISEEEPPMAAKVKAGLIFGAIVLFSVAAQAFFTLNPGS